MGYFSNSAEGHMYEEEYCHRCVHFVDDVYCPVWLMHLSYNGDDKWQPALDELIPQDKEGFNLQCAMFLSQEMLNSRAKDEQLISDKEKLEKWNEATKSKIGRRK